MKKYLVLTLLTILSNFSSLSALENSDYEEINQIIEHIANAWNDHEGQGFADDYAEDADFVNIFGMVFKGKSEIEVRHVKILQTFLKGSKFETVDFKLREVKPGLVIAHVYWKVSHVPKPNKDSSDVMKGVFTHVFVKNQDNWEITASQNTLQQGQ